MDRCVSNSKALTDYERELLIILMEECAEVVQAASKVLRFGKGDRAPTKETLNSVDLAHEIGDLTEILEMVGAARLISVVDVTAGRKRKRERLARFMQSDGPQGEQHGDV